MKTSAANRCAMRHTETCIHGYLPRPAKLKFAHDWVFENENFKIPMYVCMWNFYYTGLSGATPPLRICDISRIHKLSSSRLFIAHCT
jgi:hypothetical protein